MGLIRCPACSNEVSAQADICPHCGHPIKRGFLGRAGPERAVNVTCLVILIVVAVIIAIGSCTAMLLHR